MVYRIIILLFICSALTAQNEVKDDGLTVRYNGLVVRAQADDIVPPSGQPLAGAAGTRNLLWYLDFDDRAADGNLTSAEIDTIFEMVDQYNKGPFNTGGGRIRIIDGGGGDMHLRFVWDFPCPSKGTSCGAQIYKGLSSEYLAPDSLSGKHDIWFSWNSKSYNGFDQPRAGKAIGGVRAGAWIWSYGGETGPELDMGMNSYHAFTSAENHAEQLFWYGMTLGGGETFPWYPTYPTESGAVPFSSSWKNLTLHVHLPDNPPDSSTGYIEMYVNEILTTRYDTLSLRMNDSLTMDWLQIKSYPSSSDTTEAAYTFDGDNFAYWVETAGDSTWVGMKWLDYQDSTIVIDAPGWPIGEDVSGWGEFSFHWLWLLVLLPATRRKWV